MDLSKHPFFTRWTDPQSGVDSFILTRRVAPIQQSLYFTNATLSADQQWLWFYAAFPPSRQRCVAAVSLRADEPTIHVLPATAGCRETPMIAEEGDAVYVGLDAAVWRVPLAGEPTRICTLSEDFIAGRQLTRLATHLTASADGRYFLLDGAIGNC